MATAKDYKVEHPYGATYYPWSPRHPHRGNDRSTPMRTKVFIGRRLIAYTGTTGLSSGPHLHTQAGTDEWAQTTLNPTPYDFKTGVVENVGWGDEWGNFVIIRTDGGIRVVYAHLDEVVVQPGEVIRKDNEIVKNKEYWRQLAISRGATIRALREVIDEQQDVIRRRGSLIRGLRAIINKLRGK